MNDELLALHSRVNGIIYNPFINLKEQIKEVQKLLSSDREGFKAELEKLDAAVSSLDEFEALPHGNLERIKGFNKIKSSVLRTIKTVTGS